MIYTIGSHSDYRLMITNYFDFQLEQDMPTQENVGGADMTVMQLWMLGLLAWEGDVYIKMSAYV